jgi:hypothetical protein
VPGKINTLQIDGCVKTSVVVESCVASVDIINCKSCEIQARRLLCSCPMAQRVFFRDRASRARFRLGRRVCRGAGRVLSVGARPRGCACSQARRRALLLPDGIACVRDRVLNLGGEGGEGAKLNCTFVTASGSTV